MNYKIEDLTCSPNKLAENYNAFNVTEKLLFTGHSHQAWPDCSFEGVIECWQDASELIDNKWDKAFIKAAQVRKEISNLLNDDSGYIALASNTHELIVKFLSALPLATRTKIITTDSEFHTIRRQLDSLKSLGIDIKRIDQFPLDSFSERLCGAIDDNTSAVMISSVFFNSGYIFNDFFEINKKCIHHGSELLIDAYHQINVVPFNIGDWKIDNAFVVGGGYKYCQVGEGNCFMRFPQNTELKPIITGWFSEFSAISDKKEKDKVLYGIGPDLFAGSTYDPTSHYRATKVFDFFKENNLTPEFLREISRHQIGLLASEFDKIDADPSVITRNRSIPLDNIAGFLALKTDLADTISKKLAQNGVMTDFRGNILRFGPAPYISDKQIIDAMGILKFVLKYI